MHGRRVRACGGMRCDWTCSGHLADQPVHDGRGLVVCNPPYGKRLELEGDPKVCYREIGSHLVRAYPGWRKAMLCPDPALVKATGLYFRQVTELDNGGLRVGLFVTNPER